MIKKYRIAFITMFILLFIGCNLCFAHFLSDNPGRYYKVEDSANIITEKYVDLRSFKSKNYAPPFYQISADMYNVDYRYKIIGKLVADFYYNYDEQKIIMILTGPDIYSFNGQLLSTDSYVTKPMDVPPSSVAHAVANLGFYTFYRMFFSKELN